MTEPRVAVVGSGAWGTTLAVLIGRVEPVTLLTRDVDAARTISLARQNERRLPGVRLPDSVTVTAERDALSTATDVVVYASPSAHLRATVERTAAALPVSADIVSVVKGIETGSLMRMSEVIAEAGSLAPRRIAALSGPTLASEIARGLPASAVVAAEEPELADRVV